MSHPDEDRFEEWERYPDTEAKEKLEYQKLAWYSAPFGSTGVALVVLVAAINLLRRLGRQVIRIAARLRLV